MDGGILQVPFEQLEEFYTEYVHAIRTGTKLYVVEQKTDVFNFFVDLDYKGQDALHDEAIIELATIMHSVVQRGQCCIARAAPRIVDNGLVKSGVHIHWPEVYVTRTEALALRTRILLELPDDPEWSRRIDASVYGGSGLRMLWSHKREKGLDTDPYVPWCDLNGNMFDPVPNTSTLKLFALRTDKKSNESVNVEITCAPLERFIRRNIQGQCLANVRRVMRKGSDRIIVQTDSRYCERIQGEHKSNHVWFGITRDRICQLCHDDVCKEIKFIGREHILSPSIVDELHSNVAVDNSTFMPIRDLVPDFWWEEEQVSSRSSSVLGTGPTNMGTAPKPSKSVRKHRGKPGSKSKRALYGD
jgi:hypothetical protein